MALKPDAQEWKVREQILEDPASGLTLQFEVMPNGEPRLRIFGKNLPYGNREILFTADGEGGDAGTYTGACRPAWLDSVD